MLRLFRKPDSKSQERDPEQSLPSLYSPRSPASEAYRMLRTNIRFSAEGNSLRVIQVASTFPSEGKSLTAANLAVTFAQAGSKTVLVSADMRMGTAHKLFGIPQSPGLSEAIVTGDLQPSIVPGPIDRLSIVPSGTVPPNPSELLHSNRMDAILVQLRSEYDIVIVDSPPVLGLADTSVIAHKVDGVLMVVAIDLTNKHANQRAVSILKSVNARILGVVVTGVKLGSRNRGYHGYDDYYYYYYAYREPSRSGDEDKGESAN